MDATCVADEAVEVSVSIWEILLIWKDSSKISKGFNSGYQGGWGNSGYGSYGGSYGGGQSYGNYDNYSGGYDYNNYGGGYGSQGGYDSGTFVEFSDGVSRAFN